MAITARDIAALYDDEPKKPTSGPDPSPITIDSINALYDEPARPPASTGSPITIESVAALYADDPAKAGNVPPTIQAPVAAVDPATGVPLDMPSPAPPETSTGPGLLTRLGRAARNVIMGPSSVTPPPAPTVATPPVLPEPESQTAIRATAPGGGPLVTPPPATPAVTTSIGNRRAAVPVAPPVAPPVMGPITPENPLPEAATAPFRGGVEQHRNLPAEAEVRRSNVLTPAQRAIEAGTFSPTPEAVAIQPPDPTTDSEVVKDVGGREASLVPTLDNAKWWQDAGARSRREAYTTLTSPSVAAYNDPAMRTLQRVEQGIAQSPVMAGVRRGLDTSIPGNVTRWALKKIGADQAVDPDPVDMAGKIAESATRLFSDYGLFKIGGEVGLAVARPAFEKLSLAISTAAVRPAFARIEQMMRPATTEALVARGSGEFAAPLTVEQANALAARIVERVHGVMESAGRVAGGAAAGGGAVGLVEGLQELTRQLADDPHYNWLKVGAQTGKGAAAGALGGGLLAPIQNKSLHLLAATGYWGAVYPMIEHGQAPTMADLIGAGIPLAIIAGAVRASALRGQFRVPTVNEVPGSRRSMPPRADEPPTTGPRPPGPEPTAPPSTGPGNVWAERFAEQVGTGRIDPDVAAGLGRMRDLLGREPMPSGAPSGDQVLTEAVKNFPVPERASAPPAPATRPTMLKPLPGEFVGLLGDSPEPTFRLHTPIAEREAGSLITAKDAVAAGFDPVTLSPTAEAAKARLARQVVAPTPDPSEDVVTPPVTIKDIDALFVPPAGNEPDAPADLTPAPTLAPPGNKRSDRAPLTPESVAAALEDANGSYIKAAEALAGSDNLLSVLHAANQARKISPEFNDAMGNRPRTGAMLKAERTRLAQEDRGGWDLNNDDDLIAFVKSQGGIRPDPGGDLSGEWEAIPKELRSKTKGLTPSQMAEVVNEALGRERNTNVINDAEILRRLSKSTVRGKARSQREEVDHAQAEQERQAADAHARFMDLPEAEQIAQLRDLTGASEADARALIKARQEAAKPVEFMAAKDEPTGEQGALKKALLEGFLAGPEREPRDVVREVLDQIGGHEAVAKGMFGGELPALEAFVRGIHAEAVESSKAMEPRAPYGENGPEPVRRAGRMVYPDIEAARLRAYLSHQEREGASPERIANTKAWIAEAEADIRMEERAPYGAGHREAVEKAIAEGKDVPADVMAAYPDLLPAGQLKTEKTPLGDQVLVPDTPKRSIPTGKAKARVEQRPLDDTPLFGQDKAERDRKSDESQQSLLEARAPYDAQEKAAKAQEKAAEALTEAAGAIKDVADEIRAAVPEAPEQAPVTWGGWQERFNKEPLALWSLTQDIPGHPKGSTVGPQALQKAGFEVPEPQEAAPTGASPYKYSSVEIRLPAGLGDAVRRFAQAIPQDQLAPKGVESVPHLTVRYGLQTVEPDRVKGALTDQGPVEITLGKVGMFPDTGNGEVLYVEAQSPAVDALHEHLTDALVTVETQERFRPHVTLAFLKKGEAKAHVGDTSFVGRTFTASEVVFSPRDGAEPTVLALPGRAVEAVAEAPRVSDTPSGVLDTQPPTAVSEEVAPYEPEQAPAFFSALRDAAEKRLPARASAEQIEATLRATPGVKADEITWTYLPEWLAEQKGPIAKADVLAYLDDYGVKVTEDLRGGETNADLEARRAFIGGFEESAAVEDAARWRLRDEFPSYKTTIQFSGDAGFVILEARPASDRVSDARYFVLRRPDLEGQNWSFVGGAYHDFDEAATQAANRNFPPHPAGWMSGQTEYETYKAVKGGAPGSYRELLFLYDPPPDALTAARIRSLTAQREALYDHDLSAAVLRRDEAAAEKIREAIREINDRLNESDRTVARQQERFRPPHFRNATNMIAHVRFDTRVDSEGRRGLLIQEVQDDLDNQIRNRQDQIKKIDKEVAANGPSKASEAEKGRALVEVARLEALLPFRGGKSNDLVLKRALRYAAEQGYEFLGLATGAQQAKLYGLSQHIDALTYEPSEGGGWTLQVYREGRNVSDDLRTPMSGLSLDRVREVVGPSVARRIEEGAGAVVPMGNSTHDFLARGRPARVVKWTPPKGFSQAERDMVDARQALGPLLRAEDNLGYDTTAEALGGLIAGGDWEMSAALKASAQRYVSAMRRFRTLSTEIGEPEAREHWRIVYESGASMGSYLTETDARGDLGRQQFYYDHLMTAAPERRLEGVDLDVDSQQATGKKKTYDAILPSVLNKLAKPWGQTVGAVRLKTDNAPDEVIARYADQPDHPFTKAQFATVHAITITPEMQGALLRHGFPLFEDRAAYGALPAETKAAADALNAQDIRNNPAFARWFGASKVVDERGAPKVAYRGDNRADRLDRLRKNRASSAHGFFFTEDPEIASGYAKGKIDRDAVDDVMEGENFRNFFRFTRPGVRGTINLHDLWYHLSRAEQARVEDVVRKSGYTEEPFVDGFPQPQHWDFTGEHGVRDQAGWDYEIRDARGNVLDAAASTYLGGAILHGDGDEALFLDLLKEAGITGEYMDPWAEAPAVTPVYLAIQNPLDTAAIPPAVVDRLRVVARRSRRQPKSGYGDAWNMAAITPRVWISMLEEDLAKGEAHAWTSIPREIVRALQGLGYDGIKDTGGKMGGQPHAVWIAFEPTQAKSAIGNRGTFDPSSPSLVREEPTPYAELPARAEPAPAFYSTLLQAAEKRLMPKMSRAQVLGVLGSTPGVKKIEIHWTGLEPWLATQPEVGIKKADVLDFIRANQVRVAVKELSEASRNTDLGRIEEESGLDLSEYYASSREFDSAWGDGNALDLDPEYVKEMREEDPDWEPSDEEIEYRWSHPAGYEVTGNRESGFSVWIPDASRGVGRRGVRDDGGVQFDRLDAAQDAAGFDYFKWVDKIGGEELGPRHGDLVEPGGIPGTYRERLFVWPPETIEGPAAAQAAYQKSGAIVEVGSRAATWYEPPESHFPDAPNTIAHTRLTDGVLTGGTPVLRMEEAQSDARHEILKVGERTPEPPPVLTELPDGYKVEKDDRRPRSPIVWIVRQPDGVTVIEGEPTKAKAIKGALKVINADRQRAWSRAVPPFPWLKHWLELVMKDGISEAARTGKAWFVWTTGKQQAARWNQKITEGIAAVRYRDDTAGHFVLEGWSAKRSQKREGEWRGADLVKRVEPDELPQYVGKELAAKLIASQGEVLTGQDLTIGAEDFRALYDTMAQSFARAFAKQFKEHVPRVEDVQVRTGAGPRPATHDDSVVAQMPSGRWSIYDRAGELRNGRGWETEDEARKKLDEAQRVPSSTWHGIEITDEMRATVLTHGLPIMEPRAPFAAIPEPRYPVRDGADRAKSYALFREAAREQLDLFGGGEHGQQATTKAGEQTGPTTQGDTRGTGGARGPVRVRTVRALRDMDTAAPVRGIADGAGVRTLALALARDLADPGWIDLRGYRVANAAALGPLAQVWRNPKYETIRIVYTDDAGTILAHEASSSRSAGAASFWNDPVSERDRIAEFRQRMERLGATGYYLLHNHPSAAPVPSVEDVGFTRRMSARLPGFRGHVVIDHDTFGVIEPDGKIKQFPVTPKPDPRYVPAVPHDILGEPIRNSRDVFTLGYALQAQDGWVALLYIGADGKTLSAQEMPRNLFLYPKEAERFLLSRTNQWDAAAVFAYFPSDNPGVRAAAERLIKSGALRDAWVGQGAVGALDEVADRQLRIDRFNSRRVYRVTETPPPYNDTTDEDLRELGRAFLTDPPDYEAWAAQMRTHVSPAYYARLAKTYQDLTAPVSDVQTPSARPTGVQNPAQTAAGDLNAARGIPLPAGQALMDRLRKILDVPISEGRVGGGAGRLGFTRIKGGRAEAARLKVSEDLSTAAHEAGHVVSAIVWGAHPGARDAFYMRHSPDLMQLAEGHAKPSQEEGWAEFWRLYLQNADSTRAIYPDLARDIEDALAREDQPLLSALQQWGDDYRAWRGSRPRDRIRSHVVREVGKTRDLRGTMRRTYTNLLWEGAPLDRAVKTLAAGRPLGPEQNASLLKATLAGAPKLAEYFLFDKHGHGGTLDFATRQVTGPSLETVLSPVKATWQDWSDYMIARRLRELMGRPDDNGKRAAGLLMQVLEMSAADVHGELAAWEIEHPEYEAVAAAFQTWNKSLLKYLEDAGVTSPESRAAIEEANQDYFPFHRFFADDAEAGVKPMGAVGGVANVRSPVKTIRGSGRKLTDPLGSAVRNTYVMVMRAERNAVLEALVSLAESTPGGGALIEPLPAPQTGQQVMTVEAIAQIRRDLERNGLPTVALDMLDPTQLREVVRTFRPDLFRATPPGEIWVLRKGKPAHYQIHDPELYGALANLDRASAQWLQHPLARGLLVAPAALLRAGATLSPEFIGRNPIRDLFARLVYTAAPSKVPLVGPYIDAGKALDGFVRGIFSSIKQDDWYDVWQRSGAAITALSSLDPEMLQKHRDDVLAGRDGIRLPGYKGTPFRLGPVIKTPIELLRLVSQTMEEANRIAETRDVLKGLGVSDPRQATKGQMLKAGAAARDVTLDFNRLGVLFKVTGLHRIAAFVNPAWQSWDKLAREAGLGQVPAGLDLGGGAGGAGGGGGGRTPPVGGAGLPQGPSGRRILEWRARKMRGFSYRMLMLMTLPSLLLWWYNHQDARWSEIPQWQKDISWIVFSRRITKDQWATMTVDERVEAMRDGIVRIPKPFELGVLFGSVPERIAEWIVGESPNALKSIGQSLATAAGTSILPMPTVLWPLISVAMNWNNFFDRPVVSRGLQDIDPEFQSGPGTSRSAESMARSRPMGWLSHGLEASKLVPTFLTEAIRSPIQLESLIQGYAGNLGRIGLNAGDLALKALDAHGPAEPEKTWSDVPGIRGFLVRYPSGSATSIQDFYTMYAEAQKAVKTLQFIKKKKPREDPDAYEREHEFALLEYVAMQATAKSLTQSRVDLQEIREDKAMDAQTKRKEMDRVTLGMIEEARGAVEGRRAAEAAYRKARNP